MNYLEFTILIFLTVLQMLSVVLFSIMVLTVLNDDDTSTSHQYHNVAHHFGKHYKFLMTVFVLDV